MQQTKYLLSTKLRPPPLRPGWVIRPRLQKAIEHGLQEAVTLISAPAGFGKTTLLVSALVADGRPIAWLSLDKNDNQPRRYLTYLVAALRQVDSTIGKEAATLLDLTPSVSQEHILTTLINDLDKSDRGHIIVLDDYHTVANKSLHGITGFLIQHRPPSLHLLIASRSDPPLPILTTLRGRGQLLQIRAEDLGFNQDETRQFLNDVMQLDLSASAAATLAQKTEGWIAGLQMAALSLRGRENSDQFIDQFSGTNRYILDYLLQEVLDRQPQALQDFLLQTAFLKQFSAPLCDALLHRSDSQILLQQLERENLFLIPLDDQRQWYRYHSLFSDLLEALGKDRIDRDPLLARASAWYEQAGQIVEAIEYALASSDPTRAAHLIERHAADLLADGQVEMVWSLLENLPPEIVGRSAVLNITRCWLLYLRGRMNHIASCLQKAQEALQDSPSAANSILNAQFTALSALAARYDNALERAILLAQRALSLLPQDLNPKTNAELQALIQLTLASAHDGAGDLQQAVIHYTQSIYWSRLCDNVTGIAGITYRLSGILRLLGRLQDAQTVCREALASLQEEGLGRLPAAGILYIGLSEVLVERNHLKDARIYLAQGIELGKLSGRLDAAKNAAHVKAHLQIAGQDWNGALAAVEQAMTALGRRPSPLARAELLALKTRILIRQGKEVEAARQLQEAEQLAGWDRGLTGELVSLASIKLQVAQSKPEKAVPILGRAINIAQMSGRLGAALELRILYCLVLDQLGRVQQASSELQQALALAQPEGYIRIFLDEGQSMRSLLTRWLAGNDSTPLHGYAKYLLDQFDSVQTSSQEKPLANLNLIEPLSDRELQVLQIIASGKTNREIAQQLIIAPGTVKAHTANIYRKLDVANRTEAVTRARELGLLP